MAKENILIVDDEPDIRELVRYNLAKEGYQVACASSGEDCLKSLKDKKPDLVLLDLMLPGIDGLEVCRFARTTEGSRDLPIIIISAKGEEADIVTGLELGADDYIVKPFAPRVLLARVRSVLRRRSSPLPDTGAVVRCDGLYIDPARHEARLGDDLLDLTATEFKLLHFLARQPGYVFTRSQIVDAVHGEDYPVTDRSVDVQVVGLRRKLGAFGEYIETVRGVGYRFRDKDAA